MKKIRLLILLLALVMSTTACHSEVINYYTGTVESDRYSAMTSYSGKITEVYIEEGDQVEYGQKLAQLDTSELSIEIKRLEAIVSGAEADLERILKGAREEEVNQIRQQIEQQKDQIAILQDQLNHAYENHETMKSLFESGATSKKQLDDAKLVLDNAISKRDQAKSQKTLLEENLSLVLEGATEEELLSAQSRVDSAKWSVESIKRKMEDAVITANHDGVIEAIYFNRGEQYPMTSKFAEITDISQLKLKIYVEEMNLHRVSTGDLVNIKVDYDPEARISGIVEFISSDGEFTPKNLESKENRQEVVYEVRIRIDNPDGKLKPGMLVDVYLGDDMNE